MMSKTFQEKLLIVMFNLFPIIGVAFYHWVPFEMFWLFWMETLIISLFNTIRVLYSQGFEEGTYQHNFKIKLNYGSAIGYFITRIIIFIFYALFIIAFIGVLGSNDENSISALGVIFFRKELFNSALLLAIYSQTFYLVKYFFMNKAWYFSSPSQYPSLFDGRQIVMHIAVVLGGVGTAFLFNGKNNYGAIWIISIFCLVKCIYELFFTAPQNKMLID